MKKRTCEQITLKKRKSISAVTLGIFRSLNGSNGGSAIATRHGLHCNRCGSKPNQLLAITGLQTYRGRVEEALERAFMMALKNKGICGTTADATISKFCDTVTVELGKCKMKT
jgi:hypothetical protein